MFNTESINAKLKYRTIEAIRILTKRSECVAEVLCAMNHACHVRKIVGTVQFEQWIETKIEGRDGIYIVQAISPSPEIMEEAYNKEFYLCSVQWAFLLPHPAFMAVNDCPKSAREWLSDGEIDFELNENEDEDYVLNGLNAVGY